MKTCSKCRQTKELSAFYVRKTGRRAGKLFGYCKCCSKAYVAAGRATPAGRELYRKYDATHRARSTRAKWSASDTAAQRARRQREPEKYRARKAVKRALKKGSLLRGNCEQCGSAKTEAHHEDYSKPLNIKWLCRTCHATVHRVA